MLNSGFIMLRWFNDGIIKCFLYGDNWDAQVFFSIVVGVDVGFFFFMLTS